MPEAKADVKSDVRLELRSSLVLLPSSVTETVNETSVPDEDESSSDNRRELPTATPSLYAVTSVMEDSSSTKLSVAAKQVL